jgi:protoporphyrinogen oxidase
VCIWVWAQAARALQKHGIDFTVFEAYDDVAGVWRANYVTYKAQGKEVCTNGYLMVLAGGLRGAP